MKTKPDLPEIVEPPCWEVSPPDFSEFLQHLPAFAPNSILCLEGVSASDLKAFLLERPTAYENETKPGFLGLQPTIFYMPINESNLRGFAALTERYAEPEVCSHLRVYRDNRILLSWHDLPVDPIYVVKEYDEDLLKEFCERCKITAEPAFQGLHEKSLKLSIPNLRSGHYQTCLGPATHGNADCRISFVRIASAVSVPPCDA